MLFIHFTIQLHANFIDIYTALTICNGRVELQIKIERAILTGCPLTFDLLIIL